MKALLTTLILLFLHGISICQNGTVDLNFNPDDIGFGFGDGVHSAGGISTIKCSTIQTDGKIILCGDFKYTDSFLTRGITRIDSLGNIDTSFHTGTGFNANQSYPDVESIIVQPNGKILVGGYFSNYDGHNSTSILRLNPDGSFDSTFFTPVVVNSVPYIKNIQLLSDGRILLSGSFSYYGNVPVNNMIVIDSNGAIDPNFNTSFGSNNLIRFVKIQADGKLIVQGDFSSFNGTTANKLVRLLPDFTIDTNFNIGSGPNSNWINGITINPDGSIFVYGSFTSFSGVPVTDLVKLNTDGSIDPLFSLNNLTINSITKVLNQSNGNKIFIGDFIYQSHAIRTFRLLNNNSIDIAYNTSYMNLFAAQETQIDASDRLLYFAGYSSYFPLLRFESNGALDSSFFKYSGSNGTIRNSIPQNDGKILLYGDNNLYDGLIVNKVFRIFSNGTLDTTFHLETAVSSVGKIKQLNDGKYFAYVLPSNNSTNQLIRLNPDGTIDTTFHQLALLSNGFSPDNSGFEIQDDNKIIVWGTFTSYDGYTANRIMRINEDGSLDASFESGVGLNLPITTALLQPDQKIILFRPGNFTYNNVPCSYAVRLNADGTIDNTFSIGSGYNNQVTNAIIHNNKILLAGSFTNFNNISLNRIARINLDGSVDNSFITGTGFDNEVSSLFIQTNNKILVGGNFSTYNDSSRAGIARLEVNGMLDESLEIPGLPVSDILSINKLHNNKILITGFFIEVAGIGRNRIALLNDCESNSDTLNIVACDSYYWNNTNQTYLNSGTYFDSLTNIYGCDSVIVLNLNTTPSIPLTINTFSIPSATDTCIGVVTVTANGNANFITSIDNAAPISHSGYWLFNDLCVGVHSLQITDACGNTETTSFVIPVDSNYVFNNPFIDSIAVDSLGTTIENCDIYYNSIDTAFIDSLWTNANTVYVIWNIIDSNGSNLDTTSYELNSGNGVYWLQLSVFCPTRALGDYFSVTEAIYFEDGSATMAGLKEIEQISLNVYPNPSDGIVYVTFNLPEAYLSVTDVQGKLVVPMQKCVNQTQVDLSAMLSGVYFFLLETEKGSIVKRVVKQN